MCGVQCLFCDIVECACRDVMRVDRRTSVGGVSENEWVFFFRQSLVLFRVSVKVMLLCLQCHHFFFFFLFFSSGHCQPGGKSIPSVSLPLSLALSLSLSLSLSDTRTLRLVLSLFLFSFPFTPSVSMRVLSLSPWCVFLCDCRKRRT